MGVGDYSDYACTFFLHEKQAITLFLRGIIVPFSRNMATVDLPREEAIVEEALPALTFRVRNARGEQILAHLAGKLRLHRIRIVPGDRVIMEVSPDGGRGRIVRRL